MSVVLPGHHEQLRHVRETRAAVRQSADRCSREAYGCRREETWKTVLYPTPEAIPAVPRTDTRQKVDYAIA